MSAATAQKQLYKRVFHQFKPIFPVRKEVGEDPIEFKENIRRKVEFDLGLKPIKALGTFEVQTALVPEGFASGVVVVKICKTIQELLWLRLGERCYDLEIKLGEFRHSGTDEKEILEQKDFSHVNEELVRSTLPKFVGPIKQGCRLIPASGLTGMLTSTNVKHQRPALCHEIQLISYEPPLLRLWIRCGAGFSARIFAAELSLELDTVGYARRLHRISQGPFTYEEALPSMRCRGRTALKQARSSPIGYARTITTREKASLKKSWSCTFRKGVFKKRSGTGAQKRNLWMSHSSVLVVTQPVLLGGKQTDRREFFNELGRQELSSFVFSGLLTGAYTGFFFGGGQLEISEAHGKMDTFRTSDPPEIFFSRISCSYSRMTETKF